MVWLYPTFLLPRLRSPVSVDAGASADCERPARSRWQALGSKIESAFGDLLQYGDVRSEVGLGSGQEELIEFNLEKATEATKDFVQGVLAKLGAEMLKG